MSSGWAASLRHRLVPPRLIGAADHSDEGRGRTALVTGASAGIGQATAQLLAAKGYDVALLARREVRLKELGDEIGSRFGVRSHVLPYDLGEPGAAERISDALDERGVTVDFLVNNAGYGLFGQYLSNPWEDYRRFVQALALTPAELCYRLLPTMVERRWGRIINVTSVVGAFPGSPNMVLYSAAKSFLQKFTEGLAAECEPQGINCTVSVPGATDTEFQDMGRLYSSPVRTLVAQFAAMRPETVARQAYAACMRGRRVVIHGWHHKLTVAAVVHSPPAVRYRLTEQLTDIEPDRS